MLLFQSLLSSLRQQFYASFSQHLTTTLRQNNSFSSQSEQHKGSKPKIQKNFSIQNHKKDQESVNKFSIKPKTSSSTLWFLLFQEGTTDSSQQPIKKLYQQYSEKCQQTNTQVLSKSQSLLKNWKKTDFTSIQLQTCVSNLWKNTEQLLQDINNEIETLTSQYHISMQINANTFKHSTKRKQEWISILKLQSTKRKVIWSKMKTSQGGIPHTHFSLSKTSHPLSWRVTTPKCWLFLFIFGMKKKWFVLFYFVLFCFEIQTKIK